MNALTSYKKTIKPHRYFMYYYNNIFYIDAQHNFINQLADHITAKADCFLNDHTKNKFLSKNIIFVPTADTAKHLGDVFSHKFKDKNGFLFLPQIIALGQINDTLLIELATRTNYKYIPKTNVTTKQQRIYFITDYLFNNKSTMHHWASFIKDAIIIDKILIKIWDNNCQQNDVLFAEYIDNNKHEQNMLLAIHKAWFAHLEEKNLLDPNIQKHNYFKQITKIIQQTHKDFFFTIAGSTLRNTSTKEIAKEINKSEYGSIIFPSYSKHLPNKQEVFHPFLSIYNFLNEISFPNGLLKEINHGTDHISDKRKSKFWKQIFNLSNKDDIQKNLPNNLNIIYAENQREEALQIVNYVLTHSKQIQFPLTILTPDQNLQKLIFQNFTNHEIFPEITNHISLANTQFGTILINILSFITDDTNPCTLLFLLYTAKNYQPELTRYDDIGKFLQASKNFQDFNDFLYLLKKNNFNLSIINFFAALKNYLPNKKEELSFYDFIIIIKALIEKITNNDSDMQKNFEDKLNILDIDYIYKRKFPIEQLTEILKELLLNLSVIEKSFKKDKIAITITSPIFTRFPPKGQIILAGLNENIWLQKNNANKYYNNSEMTKYSFNSHINQSLHDLFRLCQSEDVIFSYCKKQDSVNVLPLPFLIELQELYKKDSSYLHDLSDKLSNVFNYKFINNDITLCPEVFVSKEYFPKKISPSSLMILINNPFSFYIQYILKLFPLQSRTNEPNTLLIGSLLHQILENYLKEIKSNNFKNGHDRTVFFNYIKTCYGKCNEEFYWREFLPICEELWQTIITSNYFTPKKLAKSLFEAQGSCLISFAGKTIKLLARTDRIDICDNEIEIIDYKSTLKTSLKLQLAFVQLFVCGIIAQENGFTLLNDTNVTDFTFLKVKGNMHKKKCFETKSILNPKDEVIISQTQNKTLDLIKNHLCNDKCYPYIENPINPIIDEHAQFARFEEWSSGKHLTQED